MAITRTSIIRIASVIGVVLLLLALVVRGEVSSTEATYYHTGGLDLKIDSRTYYNGAFQPQLSWRLKNLKPWKDQFFSFDDVKPGDTGTNTISLHLKKNAGYVCLDFENLTDYENGVNEPESLLDVDTEGELSDELQFFAWRDDGDMRFEPWEQPLFGVGTAADVLKDKTYAVADKNTPAPLWPYQTYYLGLYWCAGDLDVDLATGAVSCDATAMGNEAQTDSMTLDVSLRAYVAKQKPWFECVPGSHHDGGHSDNGHGNDTDGNDDSNPGSGNDEDDDTDDNGASGSGHDDNTNDDEGSRGSGLREPRDPRADRDSDAEQPAQSPRSVRGSGEDDATGVVWERGTQWRFGLADIRPFVANQFRKTFGRGNYF